MNTRADYLRVFYSLLLWTLFVATAIYLAFALIFSVEGRLDQYYNWGTVTSALVLACGTTVAGFVHYHLIFVPFFRKRKYFVYALLVLLLIVLMAVLDVFRYSIRYPDIMLYRAVEHELSRMFGFGVVAYLPFSILYTAIQSIREARQRKKTLVHEQRTSALRLLKSKLEPHFLFNTLNTIYAIAQKERAEQVVKSIDKLSDKIRGIREGDKKRTDGDGIEMPPANVGFPVPKYEPLRHFLFWWISLWGLFLLTGLVNWATEQEASIFSEPVSFLILTPSIMAATAVTIVGHYYLLFRRYVITDRLLAYFLYSLLFWVVAIGFDAVVCYVVMSMDVIVDYEPTWRRVFINSTQRVLTADVILAILYALVRQNKGLKRQRQALEQKNKENEILLLQSNVDSEYLFDALNELQSVAIDADAPQTQAAVRQLTALFRYSSEQADKETVPVQDEMAFIEQYLDLQKMRIQQSEGVKIESSITWDELPSEIAPMLLLPFVENAFKFGISYEKPSTISIDIRFENKRMECHIANTDHSQLKQFQSSGMGIANTVKRLELQYEGRYELEHGTKGELYEVRLVVKLD